MFFSLSSGSYVVDFCIVSRALLIDRTRRACNCAAKASTAVATLYPCCTHFMLGMMHDIRMHMMCDTSDQYTTLSRWRACYSASCWVTFACVYVGCLEMIDAVQYLGSTVQRSLRSRECRTKSWHIPAECARMARYFVYVDDMLTMSAVSVLLCEPRLDG